MADQIDQMELLGRSVIIVGACQSGKTTIVKDLLRSFEGAVGEVDIVCPTGGYADHLIHRDFRVNPNAPDNPEAFIDAIVAKQARRAELYAISRIPETLAVLFRRVDGGPAQAKIDQVRRVTRDMRRVIEDARGGRAELAKFDEMAERLLVDAYIEALRPHVPALLQDDLTSPERQCLEHFDINPNLVLVLDDCDHYRQLYGAMRRLRDPGLHTTTVYTCQREPADLHDAVYIYTSLPESVGRRRDNVVADRAARRAAARADRFQPLIRRGREWRPY